MWKVKQARLESMCQEGVIGVESFQAVYTLSPPAFVPGLPIGRWLAGANGDAMPGETLLHLPVGVFAHMGVSDGEQYRTYL
jgi:hypothetical protein